MNNMDRAANLAREIAGEQNVAEYAQLSRLNTAGCPSEARLLLQPQTEQALCECIAMLAAEKLNYFVLGAGSNTVFLSKFSGAVISTRALKRVSTDGQTLEAQCGCMLPSLCAYAVKKGLSGLEFAGGIPATLGGAVTMNAGAFGADMRAVTESVTVFDGKKVKEYPGSRCAFRYRGSRFLGGGEVVLGARLTLKTSDTGEMLSRLRELAAARARSQPPSKGTFGSAFKNPDGRRAWQLIDGAGLRGFRLGEARVSEKHANFIVNDGGTGENIIELISHIELTVAAKYDILLQREFTIAGEANDAADVLRRLPHAHQIQPRQGHGGGQCQARGGDGP